MAWRRLEVFAPFAGCELPLAVAQKLAQQERRTMRRDERLREP